jgi:hypothetical protein
MPTLFWFLTDFGIASSFLDSTMWQHRARILYHRASDINKTPVISIDQNPAAAKPQAQQQHSQAKP